MLIDQRVSCFWPVVYLLFVLATVFGLASATCPQLELCEDADDNVKKFLSEVGNHETEFPVPNDKQIASQGHFSGLRPVLYDLSLKFEDITRFFGSLNMEVVVVNRTKRLMIHVDHRSLAMEYTATVVTPDCTNYEFPTGLCIEAFRFLPTQNTLMLELNAELSVGARLNVSFPYFESNAREIKNNSESPGMISAIGSDFHAVYTNFPLRNARKTFPCMDHPTLKAHFLLTIQCPSQLFVVSNSVQDGKEQTIEGGTSRQRFRKTPPIATHSFAFGLLSGYKETNFPYAQSLLQLLTPMVKEQVNDWIFIKSKEITDYFHRITSFAYTLPKLTFLVEYSGRSVGSAGLGLITLPGEIMETGNSTAWKLLFRAITHQWAGGVVGVANWEEICVQEGLVAYFEWILDEMLRGTNRTENAAIAVDLARSRPYEAFTERLYDTADDVRNNCDVVPAVIYHTVVVAYGVQIVEKLLAELVSKRQFDNAGLDDWDEAMTVVVQPFGDTSGYLSQWFTQGGPIELTISSLDNRLITVQQRFGVSSPHPRPIPVLLCQSSSPNCSPLNVNNWSVTVQLLPDTNWYLLDPDDAVIARKYYTKTNYMSVLDGINASVHTQLTNGRTKAFVDGFCKNVLDDKLPVVGDFDLEGWRSLFDKFYLHDSMCKCCLKPSRCRRNNCNVNGRNCDSINLVVRLEYDLRKPRITYSVRDEAPRPEDDELELNKHCA